MPKSNGNRPVNKADGGKARAKKQMTKSRREDAKKISVKELRKVSPKKKTIVEQVMSERNLKGFLDAKDTAASNAPVIRETEFGNIRIEGEVTPAKLEAAKNFHKIFLEATAEILDLAAYTPNPTVLDFVKKQNLSKEKISSMLKAPAWAVFDVNGTGLMKTPDNKLESVQNYCYRLERAVLDISRLKDAEIKRVTDLLDKQTLTVAKVTRKLTEMQFRLDESILIPTVNSAFLWIKSAYDKVVLTLKNLLSE